MTCGSGTVLGVLREWYRFWGSCESVTVLGPARVVPFLGFLRECCCFGDLREWYRFRCRDVDASFLSYALVGIKGALSTGHDIRGFMDWRSRCPVEFDSLFFFKVISFLYLLYVLLKCSASVNYSSPVHFTVITFVLSYLLLHLLHCDECSVPYDL